jgi:serine/threonine protein kinase/ribosomal protein L37AE/L43A
VDFGNLLVDRGFISHRELEDALAIQRRSIVEGIEPIPRLGEILIRRGRVTEQQVADALAAQHKKILACKTCRTQVNVEEREDARAYKCVRCGGEMKEPEQVSSVSVIDTSVILVPRDPVPREVEAAAQDPARKMGKYVLLEELGRGGAAIVHRAWDTYLHQYVALKFLKAPPETADPEALARYETHIHDLLKEARNAIRLRHPNIVTVYDVGRLERHFFIAMDCLNGRTLMQLVREAREKGKASPFYDDPTKFITVMRDIARAVHYAHTRQVPVIHCDLKPSNIFIDQTWRPYVLDFGLAREIEKDAASDEDPGVRGTPAYMAPEQASGEMDGIDARTDVYGLGAILYELLTGQPPFTGDLLDVLHKVVHQPPRTPREVLQGPANGRRSVPPSTLEWIALKCLEKSKDRRYQAASELAGELDHVLMADAHTVRLDGVARVTRHGDAATAETRLMPTPPPVLVPAGAARPVGKLPFALAVGGLVAVTAWLILGGATGGDGQFRSEMRSVGSKLDELIGRLQVEQAREVTRLPGTDEWVEGHKSRIEYVTRLKGRLVDALNGQARYAASPLMLRTGRLDGAEVVHANGDRIVVVADGKTMEVPWSALQPQQVRAMAESAIGPEDLEVRLGLGIFLMLNGEKGGAREVLEPLRSTSLSVPANRYLDELK